MDKVITVVNGIISDIQEQQGLRKVAIQGELEIVGDLGLKSLDIAQLIAMLEVELGVDPFSTGVPLSSVVTVKDLYETYQKCL